MWGILSSIRPTTATTPPNVVMEKPSPPSLGTPGSVPSEGLGWAAQVRPVETSPVPCFSRPGTSHGWHPQARCPNAPFPQPRSHHQSYQFPVPATTTHHKLSGLKQRKCTILTLFPSSTFKNAYDCTGPPR